MVAVEAELTHICIIRKIRHMYYALFDYECVARQGCYCCCSFTVCTDVKEQLAAAVE
jgi:hypothetical protein